MTKVKNKGISKIKNKEIVQSIIFDISKFDTRSKVKNYINNHGYKLLRNRIPIRRWKDTFRVRQVNPDKVVRKSYKEKKLYNKGKFIGVTLVMAQKRNG